ncbi:hypothetical protein EI555_005434 [Monodon monoceros]|uniref:G-protein coupled receptors family 1 profile domain-containing protein n=1 Tax=Monodon monoceros TaxID=40151 RepID=A0A4U1F976_MONMO|nr:hypothetical protein EI555_005434 [Monodon monoceros]
MTQSEIVILFFAKLMFLANAVIILVSYMLIIRTILRVKSAGGRAKTFPTCASAVLFFGTLTFMYQRSNSDKSPEKDKTVSVFYTVVIPMLNALIYSLRNKDVKAAIRKVICKIQFLREIVAGNKLSEKLKKSRLLAEAIWKNVTGRTWIFTSFYSPSVPGPTALGLLNGSLTLSVHSGVMPGFEDLLSTLRPATYASNGLMLHYTQKVRFTTKAQEEVCFTKEGEMLATFDIQNIYILPDQREQTLTVGHSDLRLPPGKELLINDSAII